MTKATTSSAPATKKSALVKVPRDKDRYYRKFRNSEVWLTLKNKEFTDAEYAALKAKFVEQFVTLQCVWIALQWDSYHYGNPSQQKTFCKYIAMKEFGVDRTICTANALVRDASQFRWLISRKPLWRIKRHVMVLERAMQLYTTGVIQLWCTRANKPVNGRSCFEGSWSDYHSGGRVLCNNCEGNVEPTPPMKPKYDEDDERKGYDWREYDKDRRLTCSCFLGIKVGDKIYKFVDLWNGGYSDRC